MQGIFINGARPKSKKAVKEAVATDPGSVRIEATSVFGDEFEGTLDHWDGRPIVFVGPDPRNSRKFYGKMFKRGGKVVIE